MIRGKRVRYLAFSVAAVAAMILAACGGGKEATAPPAPTPTPARPSATATPRPAPTPTPSGFSTPIALQGKRGGTLQLSVLPGYLNTFDTFDAGGRSGVPTRNPLLSNLLWPDPYNPQVLVPDAAAGWELGEAGKVITFTLRRGIKFHDGQPLTSKDVVYNIQRGWKPPVARMNAFISRLAGVEAVEAPDDYTVRLTLKAPSHYVLVSLSITQFLLYPAHVAFPEKEAEFKANPVGSGPFRMKSKDSTVKEELVRNESYFKPGLPFVDGIVLHGIGDDAAVFATHRAGRIDAVALDYASIENQTDILVREQGFVRYPIHPGLYSLYLNQRAPFTNPKVREAVSLALDREAVLATWLQGKGTAFAAPLFPPELGGQFGISIEEMKQRPGFRSGKTQDLARAKQLLAEAGIDPSKFNPVMIGTAALRVLGEAMEASVRELGFKPKLDLLAAAQLSDRTVTGNFDMNIAIMSIQADDPNDVLGPWVVTGGGFNTAKWSNPELDRLFVEQDRELDPAKRRQLLRQIQEIVLTDSYLISGVWRGSYSGHMPWVKNYPGKLPFGFSGRFKWEQVYIER